MPVDKPPSLLDEKSRVRPRPYDAMRHSVIAFVRHFSPFSAFPSQPEHAPREELAFFRYLPVGIRKPNGSAAPRAKTRRHSCR